MPTNWTDAARALRKDQANADRPTLQHRHYAVLAGIFAKRNKVANCNGVCRFFADELAKTNPRFDRKRFLIACGIETI